MFIYLLKLYNKNNSILPMFMHKQCQTSSSDLQTVFPANTFFEANKRSIKPRHHKKKKFAVKKVVLKHLFNASLWTLAENNAYVKFLTLNTQLFSLSKIERRDAKINVLMSKAIGTRSPDQCRSHHQKMIKYHSDIPSIIRHVMQLKQNQGGYEKTFLQIQSNQMGPILRDYFEEEKQFENISYCDQLMYEDSNMV